MKNNKKEINDKELEKVNAGMKIVINQHNKIVDFFLKIKEKQIEQKRKNK